MHKPKFIKNELKLSLFVNNSSLCILLSLRGVQAWSRMQVRHLDHPVPRLEPVSGAELQEPQHPHDLTTKDNN